MSGSSGSRDEETTRAAQAAALAFSQGGGVRLQRVLPLDAPLGHLRLVSLELYEDGVVVRWLGQADTAGSPLMVRVDDDVDTYYYPAGTGAFGNAQVRRGESCFVPRVPDLASTLVISSGSSSHRVLLRH